MHVFKKKLKVKKKLGILTLASIALFSACSTDFDVTGDWKETIVVYGLLDQAQPKQYIKINKAFLGQGNAFDYAQVKDSVQFVNSMNVTLHRIKNGVDIATYTLSPDNTMPKNPGTFYGPDQEHAIYSMPSTGANALNPDSEYKLVIKNNDTGKEATSQTVLVSDFGAFSSPSASAPSFSLVSPSNDNYKFTVKFNSALNARVYQMVLRLHYVDSTTTGNVVDSLDWVSPQQTTSGLGGGQVMDFGFVGQDYMRFIGGALSDYPNLVKRTPGKVDIIIIAAADELNTFINVNRPSTGIIQEKPEYTNITNGLGIFSARYYKAPFARTMNAATLDSLSGGRYTCRLKFTNIAGVWPGCH